MNHEEALRKIAWADELGRAQAREFMEKQAALAHATGRLLGGIGSAAKSLVGAAKAAPAAGKGMLQGARNMGSSAMSSVKAAPGKTLDFLKKDWAATKGQFQAGLKGEARPALAKTPVPAVHHNAPAVAPAPAPARGGIPLGKAALVGGGALAVGAGGYALSNRNKQQPAPGVV